MSIAKHVVHKYVNDANEVYRALNGVFVIFKPTGSVFAKLRSTIVLNLCRDLNEMHVRPPCKYVSIEGPTNEHMEVIVRDSYADNTLVVGPRYQLQDFRIACTKLMPSDSSGVTVCGINSGNGIIQKLKDSKVTRFYKVKGVLGHATDNYFTSGKIVERTTYRHIRRGHIDKICSAMQASHQRKMYELCGLDIQTQTAYDLAVKGLLRPADSGVPLIYTIKCIDFSPPEFVLEIICVNEYEMYLKTIIHEIGLKLHSTATCTQILCLQDGLFTLEHALLMKNWNVKSILNSISVCRRILLKNKRVLHGDSPVLVDYNSETTPAELEKQ